MQQKDKKLNAILNKFEFIIKSNPEMREISKKLEIINKKINNAIFEKIKFKEFKLKTIQNNIDINKRLIAPLTDLSKIEKINKENKEFEIQKEEQNKFIQQKKDSIENAFKEKIEILKFSKSIFIENIEKLTNTIEININNEDFLDGEWESLFSKEFITKTKELNKNLTENKNNYKINMKKERYEKQNNIKKQLLEIKNTLQENLNELKGFFLDNQEIFNLNDQIKNKNPFIL